MKAEDIRKLGEAIAYHAELLAELDFSLDEPVYVAERSPSLGLLKNARLIEAVEDDSYFSGEYYELLRKTIHSTHYEVNTMPDIQVWLADVTHLANQYVALEAEQQEEERQTVRKSLIKTLYQMGMNLKSLIRDIDHKASSEFGYCKTLQAKIREGLYYRERTSDILTKLERLDFEALGRISQHPEIESLTIGTFFNKIDLLRSDLSLVLHKLQRLSTSFKESELRTRQLQRILHALNDHRIDTKDVLERIDWTQSALLNSVGEAVITSFSAGFDYENSTAFVQARFDDLAQKIKLPSMQRPVVAVQESVKLEVDDEMPDDHDTRVHGLLVHQQRFSHLILQSNQPSSVIGYWQAETLLKEQVTADAWLLEMSQWLVDVQSHSLTEHGSLNLEWIERPLSEWSDMVVLSDIRAQFVAKAV